MNNFKIKTTLSIYPRNSCCCSSYKTIIRGSSAILSVNLSETDYVVDYDDDGNLDFAQLVLTFKQPNGSIGTYEYYLDTGVVDSHFSYDKFTGFIDFSLSGEETASWQNADIDSPIEWEVMIITDDNKYIVMPQAPILVLNSLYNQSGGHSNPTPYVGESMLCSSTLVCNN